MKVRALLFYSKLLRAHPAKTQILTTGLIMMTGDIVSQKLIERNETIDAKRAARFFSLGILYRGPVWYVWFRLLDKNIVRGSGPMAAFKKVLVDQIFFRPVSLLCLLGLLAALHRRPWTDVKESFWTDYVSVLKTGYMFWPLAQLVNYGCLPRHLRLVYFSSVGVVWNTYLSWRVNRYQGPC
ncbi:unnamed protein product [Ixodes hexagonus]